MFWEAQKGVPPWCHYYNAGGTLTVSGSSLSISLLSSFFLFLPPSSPSFPFSPLSFSYLLSKLVDHWDHNGKLVLVYSLVYDFSTLKSYRHGKLNKFKIYYYYYDFFAHTYSISCLSLLVKNIIIYPTT